MIIDIELKAETTKLIEENTGEYLCDLGLGNDSYKDPKGKNDNKNSKMINWISSKLNISAYWDIQYRKQKGKT